MTRFPLLALLALAGAAGFAAAPATDAGKPASGFSATVVAEGLSNPVALAFAPDGTLYYAELATGNVRAVDAATGIVAESPVARVEARAGGNGGFLGLAVPPGFEASKPVFHVYYTTSVDGKKINRVSRLDDGQERILLDRIPWAEMHDGGRLLLLPDGTLLATVGENEKGTPAQDPDSVLGKILRMNVDGTAPADNPRAGSLVWASGVRNPFGLCRDPEGGTVYFSDNGPSHDDELNVLVKGANYGWPHEMGPAKSARYRDPIVHWKKTIGPTGCAVLRGAVYLGDFNAGAVHRIDPSAQPPTDAIVWRKPGERVLDVARGPDDALYVSTYQEIYRVAVDGVSAAAPPRAGPSPPAPTPASPAPSPGPTPGPSGPTPTPTPASPQGPDSFASAPSPTRTLPAAAWAALAAAALAAAIAGRRREKA